MSRMCVDWLCPHREPKQLIKVFSREDIRFDCDITDISEKSMNCEAKCSYGEMLEADITETKLIKKGE
ncbi:unnamed protein product [marine sediment metagenome]|uniref:Uncharacterized protein n=1 Tax=marine sediment metagenome TaxID=412755 RepID=X0Z970_9ZZZZ